MSCSSVNEDVADYGFQNSISQEVLENYLSRAITQGEFCIPSTEEEFNENLRMLTNIGAKFIGRAAFEWTPQMDNAEHFKLVKECVDKAHAADPDMVLQCCIFEAIFRSNNQLTEYGVDLIRIPDYVFDEFGLPREDRTFRYEDMLYEDGRFHNHWVRGASVPDITRTESQMYFFYRAAEYINAGIEAIHLGQIELMNFNDKSNKCWFDLVARIRKYASTHARRGYVIFDAHVPSHGVVSEDGHLLLDFHSFPMRPKDVRDPFLAAELQVGYLDALYCKSKGGIAPSGWTCESLPYLVEFDNSGCDRGAEGRFDNPNPAWPWGWDEITWFAHCSGEYRDFWLEYAINWLEENDPVGHLQVPGRTTIAADPLWIDGRRIGHYLINNPSPACPDGFGQEEKVKELWNNN